MDNLILYLLKVSSGTIIFYLFYILFLSKDTFYIRNRIYLLMSMVLSFVIPLLNIFKVNSGINTIAPVRSMHDILLSENIIESAISERVSTMNPYRIVMWVYFIIAGLLLLRIIISLIKTFSIIREGTIQDASFPKIIISDREYPPFSFFPYVVIPRGNLDRADYTEILNHENAHVRQGHTFDMLLCEVLITFLWFNPFIWLIKRSVILNHEYLADSHSISKSISKKNYQYNLLNISNNLLVAPLAHTFTSQIKKRIAMINKKATHKFAALKILIVLPALATLIILYSCHMNISESGVPDSSDIQKSQLKSDRSVRAFIDGYFLPDTLNFSDFLKASKLSLDNSEYSIESFTMLISYGGWDYENVSTSDIITQQMKEKVSEIASQTTQSRYIIFKDIIIKKPGGEQINIVPVIYFLRMKKT
jgi:hypothetical protein